MTNDLRQVTLMLEALLRSQNHIHWIGGWVGGRTSQGDPYVLLYAASELLKEKIVRVYDHDIGKLPAFIPKDAVPADTDANPSKDKARQRGIYHECPQLFQIVTYDGRETPMGPERRFHGVLRIARGSGQEQGPDHEKNEETLQKPPSPKGPETAPGRAQGHDEDAGAHWRVQAATATEAFMFDTAMAKAEPWFKDSGNVQQFRSLFFGEWDAARTGDYVIALEAYAAARKRLNGSWPTKEAHARAKEEALAILQQETSGG